MEANILGPTRVRGMSVRDIRFPTSLEQDGSDAVHPDPDYSCAYVVLFTDDEVKGYGLSFTIGRGNDLVVSAVKALAHIVVGQTLESLLGDNLKHVFRKLASEPQMRWLGPEKGVVHLATGAIINALWDLWARIEQKPLWKLLVDMAPEKLVETIDFRYISDALTKEEAIEMLRKMQKGKESRENIMRTQGYPAYTTAAGWLGYSEEKIKEKCYKFMEEGWKNFKLKVGSDLENDKKRCAAVRHMIGEKNLLMVDANQKWDVNEAIAWMKELAPYRPLWIEEPTSPDDVVGHATIAKALKPLNIGVATGEVCANRVMFKQLLQLEAISYCQIDAARMGGVSEVLSVYLMANKFNVPVCPHAGGVGLCEMVQHLQMWDYICVSGTRKDRLVEYVDHLSEHFKAPARMVNSHYMPPKCAGYSVEMKEASLAEWEYPGGPGWKKLYEQGKFEDPREAKTPLCEPADHETPLFRRGF